MEKHYIHKKFPKTCDSKDFFGQVKRTVNGQPVGEDQIQMIINAIKNGLAIKKGDILLDVGCGNGALSQIIFEDLDAYRGVDFSEYLILVAKENFEKEFFEFYHDDALSFLKKSKENHSFNKVLCYGVFSYFEKEQATEILSLIHQKYTSVEKFYIGNLPDKEKAENFFYEDIDYAKLLDDPYSSIGIWRTKEEFRNLCNSTGWNVEFYNMPTNYYAAHYRYDVILTPKK